MTQINVERTAPPPEALNPLQEWWRQNQKKYIPYIFIAPNLAIFTLFVFIPILYALYMSLFEWKGIGVPEFIGLQNYTELFQDPVFWTSVTNTIVFAMGAVPFSMLFGLMVALGLNQPRVPGRALLRTIYFIPFVISAVATATTVSWLFNDSFGIINKLLALLGLAKVQWLSSPDTAMLTVIIATIWVRLGFCMIIYLAGLQSIPNDMLEAARVDGALPWQQLFYIKLPLLRSTTFLLLILNVIYSFESFDLIYVMTNGGPGYSTTVVPIYIYNMAFETQRFGYASAIGLVFMMIIMAFTVVQWRMSNQGGRI
ncbi:sugar ABC transporter permease [Phototrophicus methaneseepsis]|uniref:Sugar ABC transporter permease n=1 Tax=Phototrophicus methaneseepsis TaxID=2710758 RepID=A0A7S8EDH9_9CHLR|nr:sugar ABC transporter permease [Phototrophicus methaneseepsis]QPC84969.1 sugar ABC transporter permease [Phototrophicus methaneseepsis]